MLLVTLPDRWSKGRQAGNGWTLMSSGEYRGSCYCWEGKARPRTDFNTPLDSGVRIISPHSWSKHFVRLFPSLFSAIDCCDFFFSTQPMRHVVIAVYSFLPSGIFSFRKKGIIWLFTWKQKKLGHCSFCFQAKIQTKRGMDSYLHSP